MDVGQELERGSQGHQLWSRVSDCLRGAWGRRRGMRWPEAAAEACSGRAQHAAAGPLVPPRARRRASATRSGCGNWRAVARGRGTGEARERAIGAVWEGRARWSRGEEGGRGRRQQVLMGLILFGLGYSAAVLSLFWPVS